MTAVCALAESTPEASTHAASTAALVQVCRRDIFSTPLHVKIPDVRSSDIADVLRDAMMTPCPGGVNLTLVPTFLLPCESRVIPKASLPRALLAQYLRKKSGCMVNKLLWLSPHHGSFHHGSFQRSVEVCACGRHVLDGPGALLFLRGRVSVGRIDTDQPRRHARTRLTT